MFNPIYSNEYFIAYFCSNIPEDLLNTLAFITTSISINIVQNYLELKIAQTEEINSRKIIHFMKDENLSIILYEGRVYPDYKRKITLTGCKICLHEQRFNFSDTTPNFNYIVISFEDALEEDNIENG